MRWKSTALVSLFAAVSIGLILANAQPEGGKKKGKGDKGPGGQGSEAETVAVFVEKMMAFNKAKDGKLTKKEVTDPRLHGLFDRADTDKDGVVTKEELEALFAKEGGAAGGGPSGDKGGKGKGKGPNGPPSEGKKDKGPPGQRQVNESSIEIAPLPAIIQPRKL